MRAVDREHDPTSLSDARAWAIPILATVGIVFSIGCNSNESDVVQNEPPVSAATGPLKDAGDETESEMVEIERFWQRVVSAAYEEDVQRVADLIDTDEMALLSREAVPISSQSGFEATPLIDSPAVSIAVSAKGVESLIGSASQGGWADFRVHRVARLPDQPDARLIELRAESVTDPTKVMQVWIHKATGDMRIYDWQEAQSPLRLTTQIGVAIASLDGNEDASNIHLLLTALSQAERGQAFDAERTLSRLSNDQLPGDLESLRAVVAAELTMRQGLTEKAAASLEQARTRFPELPQLDRLQAQTQLYLGDYEAALTAARSSITQDADRSVGHSLAGEALLGLGRNDEAVSEFRAGLEADGESLENLIGLARAIPGADDGELVTLFMAAGSQPRHFAAICNALLESRNLDPLESVIECYRDEGSSDPLLSLYDGELSFARGDLRSAIENFREAAQVSSGSDLESRITKRWLDVALELGDPLTAYKAAADSRLAFDYLASSMLKGDDLDGVIGLALAHLERDPNDAQAHYYSGVAHRRARRLDVASSEFARGMALVKDTIERERFRSEAVATLFEQGKTLEAYRSISPQDATFDQLARRCAEEERADDLQTLIDARQVDHPDDPTIGLWQAEIAWINGDLNQVIDVCERFRDSILADPKNQDRYEDRLIRSLIRTGRFYEALTEAVNSTSRDGDPWFEALVHAAAGNAEAAQRAIQRCLAIGYTAEDIYSDPDFAKGVRSAALAPLALRFSEPQASAGNARKEVEEEEILIIE